MLERVTEKIPMDLDSGLKRTAPLLKMASPFLEKKAAATVADFLNRRREARWIAEHGESTAETSPEPSWVERSLLPLVSALVLGIGVGISAGILWAKKAGE